MFFLLAIYSLGHEQCMYIYEAMVRYVRLAEPNVSSSVEVASLDSSLVCSVRFAGWRGRAAQVQRP